jgi:predicted Zn-ribbon and HTH transcriptional regulator
MRVRATTITLQRIIHAMRYTTEPLTLKEIQLQAKISDEDKVKDSLNFMFYTGLVQKHEHPSETSMKRKYKYKLSRIRMGEIIKG